MANAVEVMTLILELVWTLIKMTVINIRDIIKTFFPEEPKNVNGEIILITGTGHGMGREMALRFSRLGAIVICVDINPKGNEETVNMIKENGGNAHRYEIDVTDRAAVRNLAEKVQTEVGEVTILVNNAGIMPCKQILRWSEREIRSTMDINVNANLWMIQAFLPGMKERNQGHIVAMSSMAGIMGVANLVPYCGSKFAVRGIMDGLNEELNSEFGGKCNINLTTICPSMVNTGLCQKPRMRFQGTKMVEPGEAADVIIDAVRRNIRETTIPTRLHYVNRYFGQLISRDAIRTLYSFVGIGCDAHD